jgi:hypothetical protein
MQGDFAKLRALHSIACSSQFFLLTTPYMRAMHEALPELLAIAEASEGLRADAMRLDWLEQVGFTTRNPATTRGDRMNVHCWFRDDRSWGWTAQYIGSEFKSAREAIDAAMAKESDAALSTVATVREG